MLNNQPAEKVLISDPNYLEVFSIFPTIQGEGPFAGLRSVFVRLAGCNLQCPGCDTDYTSSRRYMSTEEIIGKVQELADNEFGDMDNLLVVITGGEPFRQNLSTISRDLIDLGFTVQVETNGTMRPSPNLPDDVVVVCSPKTSRINRQLSKRADHFKYVLSFNSINPADGLPVSALGNGANDEGRAVARPPEGFDGEIFLQPMDTKNEAHNKLNIDAVTRSCIYFGYTLQLQIHKYIGVE